MQFLAATAVCFKTRVLEPSAASLRYAEQRGSAQLGFPAVWQGGVVSLNVQPVQAGFGGHSSAVQGKLRQDSKLLHSCDTILDDAPGRCRNGRLGCCLLAWRQQCYAGFTQ